MTLALVDDKVDFLSNLSEDIGLKILSNVFEHQTLACASMACKHWQRLVGKDTIWEYLYRGVFPKSFRSQPGYSLEACTNWGKMYRWKSRVDANWRRVSARLHRTLEGHHQDWINAVKCCGDGRIVSGGNDHQLIVWPAEGGRQSMLQHHDSEIRCLDVGTSRVASGDDSGKLMVVDLNHASCSGHAATRRNTSAELPEAVVAEFARDDDVVLAVQVLPGEQQVLSSYACGDICLWDLRAGSGNTRAQCTFKVEAVQEVYLHPEESSLPVFAVQSHDHLVVGGADDGRLHCFDTRMQRKIAQVAAHCFNYPLYCLSMNYPRLASGSQDCSVCLWDVSSLRNQPQRHTSGAAAAACERSEAEALCLGMCMDHYSPVYSVCLAEDWRLVSAGKDGTVCLWDTAGALPGRSLPRPKLHLVHWWTPSCDTAATSSLSSPPRSPHATFPPAHPIPHGRGPSGAPPVHLQGCAMHAVDLTETMMAVAGRDNLVRLYCFEQGQAQPYAARGKARAYMHRV